MSNIDRQAIDDHLHAMRLMRREHIAAGKTDKDFLLRVTEIISDQVKPKHNTFFRGYFMALWTFKDELLEMLDRE